MHAKYCALVVVYALTMQHYVVVSTMPEVTSTINNRNVRIMDNLGHPYIIDSMII